MKIGITLLGTGGPNPDPTRQGPATLVEIAGRPLLFDTGRGVVLQLTRAGVPLQSISPLFITHHHYDHIGDLADLMITSWMKRPTAPMQVLGPLGTRAIVETLQQDVYERDIRFRSEGEPIFGEWLPPQVRDVAAGLVWEQAGIKVFAEPVEHGHGLNIPGFNETWVCLGYRIEAGGKVIVISGDTVPCTGLARLARGADALVLCCMLAIAEITTEHFRRLARYTLTCSDRAGKVAAEAGVKTLILTHIRPKSPALLAAMEQDVRRDFSGRVIMGQDLLHIGV